MDTAIISSLISVVVAILVCMVNNHFTMKRTEKAQHELERRANVLEEKQRVANHQIDDLEKHIDDGR